ncbi:hypothetical protein YC2023_006167 [Brassica napus]
MRELRIRRWMRGKSYCCYEKAALERPMYTEAYCNMGVIYKNSGDLEMAITCCYERVNRMVILQGEMDAAASMIEKQSRQNPLNPVFSLLLFTRYPDMRPLLGNYSPP